MDPKEIDTLLENARANDLDLQQFKPLTDALEEAGRHKEWVEVMQLHTQARRKKMERDQAEIRALREEIERNAEIRALREESKRDDDELRALREESKRDDDELRALREESKRDDDELRALREQSKRDDDKLRALREQSRALKEQSKQDARLIKRSIEKVYLSGSPTNTNGMWTCPRLKLDSWVKPSTAGHHRKGMAVQTATYVKKNRRKYFSGNKIFSKNKLKDLKVTTVRDDGDGEQNLPSYFGPDDLVRYIDEFGLQIHSAKMVDDARMCLNAEEELFTSMEESIFGITPDILVITKDGKIIFVIEIKAPEREKCKDNVFEHENVAGQIWLYLMMMKANGIENPLGAIFTFNKIRIVSLKDLEEHRFEDAFKMLGEGDIKWRDSRILKEVTSPAPKTKNEHVEKPRYDAIAPWEAFPDSDLEDCDGTLVFKSAALYGSTIQEDAMVFPALVLSLATAVLENGVVGDAKGETIEQAFPIANNGEDLSRRLYAWGTKKSIGMAFTRKNLKVAWGKKMPKNTANFHIGDKLGEGYGAEVRLGMSVSGIVCTLKFHHFGRYNKKMVEEMLGAERKIWNILYKKFDVRELVIGGRPCLLLPYGKPLCMKERKDCFEDIKQELLRFAKEGFLYEGSWRHVMTDHNNNIFLFDMSYLTDLIQISTESDSELSFWDEKQRKVWCKKEKSERKNWLSDVIVQEDNTFSLKDRRPRLSRLQEQFIDMLEKKFDNLDSFCKRGDFETDESSAMNESGEEGQKRPVSPQLSSEKTKKHKA